MIGKAERNAKSGESAKRRDAARVIAPATTSKRVLGVMIACILTNLFK
jgi:hypothetical protein